MTDHREKEQRLEFAEEQMLSSTNRVAARTVAEKFGVSTRQAMRYLREVRQRWADEAREYLTHEAKFERRAELRARGEDLYARALGDKDYRAAERIWWRLVELDGVQEPTRIEVEHTHKLEQMSDAELIEASAKAEKVLSGQAMKPLPGSGEGGSDGGSGLN